MIISKTPYRVSFFGGGTDYPAWYRREGGAVLSTTIDKYCYISCRFLPPYFSNIRHRVVWSHIETVATIDEILHPAVRAGLQYLGFDDSRGLEIHHQGDLPARTGMGTSSSFAVGLIKALSGLAGQALTPHALALKAIALEQDVLREHVGSQDQVAAAYGGLNVVRFRTDGEIVVTPLALSSARRQELESRLLLVFTGMSRIASSVAADVVANLELQTDKLRAMRAMVDRGADILTGSGDLDGFGRLLHEAWTLKRGLSAGVSAVPVDRVYETGLKHGALGGKLLGAGGSGFVLFYVPPARRAAVLEALAGYLHVPFSFEQEGSTVLHQDKDAGQADRLRDRVVQC